MTPSPNPGQAEPGRDKNSDKIMSISEILRVQPALEKAWAQYCEDDDDDKLDLALEQYGLVRDEDGDIHDAD